MLRLQLLGTQGCHLCDEAEQVLAAALDLQQVAVELVDIVESDALMDAYALRIPVLVHEASAEDLGWPFDAAQARAFVAALKA